MTKTTRLTNKQELFAKYYATGNSGKKAAILAGYSEHSAESIASENLTKPEILAKIESVLDKAGLTDEALAEKLQRAIDAGLEVRASNGDALKGIRIAYELKNRFPSKVQNNELEIQNSIQLKLQTMSKEEVASYLAEITKKTQFYLKRLEQIESTPA